MKWLDLSNIRNGLFLLIPNKQTIELKVGNVTSGANNTGLMQSAATGHRLTWGSSIVRPQLTASEQQA